MKFSLSPTWKFILRFYCDKQVIIETRRVVQWPVLLTLNLEKLNQKKKKIQIAAPSAEDKSDVAS